MNQTTHWRLRRARLLYRQIQELRAALADHQQATQLLRIVQREEERRSLTNESVPLIDQTRLAIQHATQYQHLVKQYAERSSLIQQVHQHQKEQLQAQIKQEQIRQN